MNTEDNSSSLYQETLEKNYDILIKQLKAKGIELPFDLHRVTSYNPLVYGDLGDGPLNGKQVKFTFGSYSMLTGTSYKCKDIIGSVVGDKHGRIVLYIPESDAYLGWLEPHEYQILYVQTPDRDLWNH